MKHQEMIFGSWRGGELPQEKKKRKVRTEMEKYIVLKPGVSIDKVEGMAYNELIKHAAFIGTVTPNGQIRDEISGAIYSHNGLMNLNNGDSITNDNELYIGEYLPNINILLIVNHEKVTIGDMKDGIAGGKEKSSEATASDGKGLFIFYVHKILEQLQYEFSDDETHFLARPKGSNEDMYMLKKPKNTTGYMQAIMVDDLAEMIRKNGTCNTRFKAVIGEGIFRTYYYTIDITLKGSTNLVSKQQLKDIMSATNHFQANAVSDAMVDELNNMLQEYNITKIQEIQMFLAVVTHETRLALTEAGWLSEAQVRQHCQRYEPGTYRGDLLGNTQNGDGYLFRGAGYIQLTGRDNYGYFSTHIKNKYSEDVDIMTNGADCIASKYAWTAAGYFWEKNKINQVIANGNTNGLTVEGIFKKVSNAVFNGNANESSDPGEWSERKDRLDEVIKLYY